MASSTDYVNRKRQYARIYTTKRLASDLAYKKKKQRVSQIEYCQTSSPKSQLQAKNREAAKVNTPKRLLENDNYYRV